MTQFTTPQHPGRKESDDAKTGSSEKQAEVFFEQYKMLVESSLHTSDRRSAAHQFFLAINTALFGGLGAASAIGLDNLRSPWAIYIGIAGVVLAYYWFRLIESYKGLNAGKFKLIHRLEQTLPAKIFTDEWELLGNGKDPSRYRPISDLEMKIPWVFATLYLALLTWGVLDTLAVGLFPTTPVVSSPPP